MSIFSHLHIPGCGYILAVRNNIMGLDIGRINPNLHIIISIIYSELVRIVYREENLQPTFYESFKILIFQWTVTWFFDNFVSHYCKWNIRITNNLICCFFRKGRIYKNILHFTVTIYCCWVSVFWCLLARKCLKSDSFFISAWK